MLFSIQGTLDPEEKPLWSRSEAEAGLKRMLWRHNVSPLLSASPSLPPSHLLPLYTQALQLILSELYIFIHEGKTLTALLSKKCDRRSSVSDA